MYYNILLWVTKKVSHIVKLIRFFTSTFGSRSLEVEVTSSTIYSKEMQTRLPSEEKYFKLINSLMAQGCYRGDTTSTARVTAQPGTSKMSFPWSFKHGRPGDSGKRRLGPANTSVSHEWLVMLYIHLLEAFPAQGYFERAITVRAVSKLLMIVRDPV